VMATMGSAPRMAEVYSGDAFDVFRRLT